MILSIVLYRYKTWSCSMGKTKKEPTGEWIKLHNEVLICTQVVRSRNTRWMRYTTCMGKTRCIQHSIWKHQRKRPLWRLTNRWEDNVWMDKMVWGCRLDSADSDRICEDKNDNHSDSIKSWHVLNHLSINFSIKTSHHTSSSYLDTVFVLRAPYSVNFNKKQPEFCLIFLGITYNA